MPRHSVKNSRCSIVLLFMLFAWTVTPARHVKKPRSDAHPQEAVTGAATGTKEYAMSECIEKLGTGLSRLADAMDDYDFDRIHELLFNVYGCYSSMDSIVAPPVPVMPDTQPAIVTASEALKMKTQLFIDSFIITMEKKGVKTHGNDSATTDPASRRFKPVIRRSADSTLKPDGVIEPDPFEGLTRRRSDTAASAIIVPDKDVVPKNPVGFEIEKLRERTADIHRFFDAGEFSMSRSGLEWLIERVSKVKAAIITYTALQDSSSTGAGSSEKGTD